MTSKTSPKSGGGDSAKAEKTQPYVLTDDVDGLGPKGRVIPLAPSKAKGLPCRKAKDRDLALAQI